MSNKHKSINEEFNLLIPVTVKINEISHWDGLDFPEEAWKTIKEEIKKGIAEDMKFTLQQKDNLECQIKNTVFHCWFEVE